MCETVGFRWDFGVRPTAAGEVCNLASLECLSNCRLYHKWTRMCETVGFRWDFGVRPTAAGEVCNLASLECLSNCRFYHKWTRMCKALGFAGISECSSILKTGNFLCHKHLVFMFRSTQPTRLSRTHVIIVKPENM